MSLITIKIQELNTPSPRTGRVFTTTVMQEAINNIDPNTTIVASTQKEELWIGIENITHIIKNLRIEDGWLLADAIEVNTPVMNSLKQTGVNEFKFYLAGIGNICDGNIVKNFKIMYLRSEPQ